MIRRARSLTLAVVVLAGVPALAAAQDGSTGPLRQVFGPPVQTLKQVIQGERPIGQPTTAPAPGPPVGSGEPGGVVAKTGGDEEVVRAPAADTVPLPRIRPLPESVAAAATAPNVRIIRLDFAARFEAAPVPAGVAAPADPPPPAPVAQGSEGEGIPLLSYAPGGDEAVPLPRTRAAAGAVRLASLPTGRAVDTPTPSGCMQSLKALGVEAIAMAPIKEGGCGIAAPTAVSALGGGNVTLSDKAILSCRAAEMLAEWMRDEVQPAARKHLGGSVTGIRVAASYHCRGRNNVAGAKLSEHAFGNAIDISAFRVEGVGWVEVGKTRGASAGQFVRSVRTAACGPFTTVLGPGADPYHSDHLHLDVIRRGKNGNSLYCK